MKKKYIGSEKELKNLPDVFPSIPTDQTKKIAAVTKVFDKIIKKVPEHKKIKISYDKNNDFTIE